jgi:D-glucosaminate-6-phosphate ammonia-lyase
MKVTKEEIVGLVTALEMFVQEDEEAEMNAYRHKSQQVVDALVEIPGLELTVEQDDYDHMIPSAVIHFGDEWSGPSKGQVLEALAAGQPAIHFSALSDPDKLEVDATNLEDSDVDVLARRLREELLR